MRLRKAAARGLRHVKARLASRVLPLLRAAWPVYGADDWSPAHHLRATGKPRRFESEGADPHFRLAHTVPAGWYMFEARLRLPSSWVEAKLYPDSGEGESEATALPLRLHSERLCKRLVYLAAPARLRFDPLAAAGPIEVQHLRLTRVGTGFARSRLRQKLVAKHPLHARRAAVGATAAAEELTDGALWADYCKLFRRGSELVSYQDWIACTERPQVPTPQAQRATADGWSWKPTLSVVIPTYNTDPDMLRACLDSVFAQGYPHWELCIADDASTKPHVREILTQYAQRDPRVKVEFRSANGHIVAASNSALALAGGEFVVLLDHDDELPAHALFAVAEALQARPSAQLLYSDEDKLDEDGNRCGPYFKPDFALDLLYSQNYFSHLGVYRRTLVEAVGGFRAGYEGSQDYDLVLRCVAKVTDHRDILHVPQVLYHWRMAEGSTARGQEQKSYASDAGRRALQDHFDSTGQMVTVTETYPCIYRHRWSLPQPQPLVSLIVPTRDGVELLGTCVESIRSRTTYANYEILIVDNDSTCTRTLAYMAQLEADGHARVLRYAQPFNYSAINNFAARHARGSILGLVNNDIEVINPDWLSEMVSHVVRPDIGCVGAKLYYPDGTIQHAGVVCGMGGIAAHVMRHLPKESPGYFGRLWVVYNPSAVTAAALLVRKDVFDGVGGLDEEGLPVAFNDVDLCLKVQEAGYRNLWTPFAELVHHESVSRGSDETPAKRARFAGECALMRERWAPQLAQDRNYNRNLTLHHHDCSLRVGG